MYSRVQLVGIILLTAVISCSRQAPPSAPDDAATDVLAIPGNVVARPWPEGSFITTFMGTGVAGRGPDSLPPLETALYLPLNVTFSPDGEAYVVDWNNHRILKVSDGLTIRVVGTGNLGPGDDGPAREVSLNHPTHVAFGGDGYLYLAGWHNSKVMRVNLATEWLERICGNGNRGYGGDDGPAIDAVLNLPVCVVPDVAGRLFITDQVNERIRVIGVDGIIRTYAGNGTPGFSGDGGPATEAQINLPRGQAGDPNGHIAIDVQGNLYLADTNNHRIRKVDAAGIISTVAGNGTAGFSGDGGPAIEASLKSPADVEIGPDGRLYIADTYNHCIRRVDLATGIIVTVAGTGGVLGSSGDGGPPTSATLNLPYGICLDEDGNLYIADTLNNKIRVVYR
jgi:DNA-binding beta-propeller fold protein YncE